MTTPSQDLSPGLRLLDRLESAALERQLATCCGSGSWVASMSRRRPFADVESLLRAAEEAADELGPEDWLEAFSHHPRIGDVESLQERFGQRSGSWSRGEQAGLDGTSDEVLERLAAGNRSYEQRFGWIFLVCASGKSAAQMLELLDARLGNAPEAELTIAAGEQRKITRLRLLKLLGELGRERLEP